MWFKQLITGADNETVAIGRVLGIAVALVFIFVVPVVSFALMARGVLGETAFGAVMDKLEVYIPALLLAVGGTIGLTAYSEPKGDK